MRYVRNTLNFYDKVSMELTQMDMAEQTKAAEKMAADLDYIAMMTDVELEQPEMEDGFYVEE